MLSGKISLVIAPGKCSFCVCKSDRRPSCCSLHVMHCYECLVDEKNWGMQTRAGYLPSQGELRRKYRCRKSQNGELAPVKGEPQRKLSYIKRTTPHTGEIILKLKDSHLSFFQHLCRTRSAHTPFILKLLSVTVSGSIFATS